MIQTHILRRIRHSALACLLMMPATHATNIFVTTTSQKVSSSGGCSLQEAIYAANRLESTAIAGYGKFGAAQVITTQCVAGTPGGNTIILPDSGFFPMSRILDDADNFTGPTATPIITSNIKIFASGSTFQRTGSLNFRLFAVGAGATLTIQDGFINGFQAQG